MENAESSKKYPAPATEVVAMSRTRSSVLGGWGASTVISEQREVRSSVMCTMNPDVVRAVGPSPTRSTAVTSTVGKAMLGEVVLTSGAVAHLCTGDRRVGMRPPPVAPR